MLDRAFVSEQQWISSLEQRSSCQQLTFYRGIHADVIVYSFAHLHTALRREENMLDMN